MDDRTACETAETIRSNVASFNEVEDAPWVGLAPSGETTLVAWRFGVVVRLQRDECRLGKVACVRRGIRVRGRVAGILKEKPKERDRET